MADWVARQIPHMAVRVPDFPFGEVFGVGAAIGVVNPQGQLVAGVVYHNYDPYCRSIEMSCAATSHHWAKPEIVRALLRYCFTQLKCQRATAVTPRRATSPRRFLEGLGFKREGSIRRGFGDDSAIVYGLLAEEWAANPRSLEPGSVEHGQEIWSASSSSA